MSGTSSAFPGGSAGNESTCNVGDLGSIPGLGRSPGEGKGYPLRYFGLENSMDYIDHVVAKSRTQLNDFTFTFHVGEGNGNPLQCSCLENPREGEPGGLLSLGSHRVGHD